MEDPLTNRRRMLELGARVIADAPSMKAITLYEEKTKLVFHFLRKAQDLPNDRRIWLRNPAGWKTWLCRHRPGSAPGVSRPGSLDLESG